jgi:hypothetical protein
MSLFEWLGERQNPGPTGSIDVRGEGRIHRISLGWTLVRFTFTLGLFMTATLGVALATGYPLYGAIAAGGFVLYLVLGYFVRPDPDTSNLGWAGGLVDDPFRYSDDHNRFLLFLALALFPGYLLAMPAVELFRWVAGETEA